MQKQCYVVLSTITKSVEIQWAVFCYNLINSCGSVSPAINEEKEVELMRHNIQKWNTHLLSRKKTSVSNDRTYGYCEHDKTVEIYKKKWFLFILILNEVLSKAPGGRRVRRYVETLLFPIDHGFSGIELPYMQHTSSCVVAFYSAVSRKRR
jgi:hypothetical protein